MIMVTARIKETDARGTVGKFAGFDVRKRSAGKELRTLGHQAGHDLILPDRVARCLLLRLGERPVIGLSCLVEHLLWAEGRVTLDIFKTHFELFRPVLMLDKADPWRAEPFGGECASSRFHPVAAAAVASDVHEERIDRKRLEGGQLALKRRGKQVRRPEFHAVAASFVARRGFLQAKL